MNLLKDHFYYLSGPIDYAVDPISWRKMVEEELNKIGCRPLNPCDKPQKINLEDAENIKRRHSLKANNQYDELTALMEPIRLADLRLVDKCDFLVVHLDNSIQTCGTWEEIFIGNRLKRPVLIHCEQGKKTLSDWLFGTLPHEYFFDTWEELFQYIGGIDRGENRNYMGRWQFFDYKKLEK